MAKRQIGTLDSFILKKIRVEGSEIPVRPEASSTDSCDNNFVTHTPCIKEYAMPSTSTAQQSTPQVNYDIGVYIDPSKGNISDTDKYNLLKKSFVPGKDFSFPFSLHKKKDKEVRCSLNSRHFELFNWLTYSEKQGGIFCRFCCLFARCGGIHKSTPLNKLVRGPLCKYSKLLGKDGDLCVHEANKYHQQSKEYAENFIHTYENPEKQVTNVLDSRRNMQIKQKDSTFDLNLNTEL